MTYLALTDFLDVVSKSGSPKATKVREIKNRGPYTPATDFYKPLREGLVDIHQSAKAKSSVQGILLKVNDKKKHANYQTALDGYEKWWGSKNFTWFAPPAGSYAKNGFELSINPELGLEYNGKCHVIKLYMKDVQLTKLRTDLITALMTHVLGQSVQSNVMMSVLDVRQSKLIVGTGNVASLMPMVDAEIAYIAALWPSV
jgi:hypothetical protein